MARSQGICTEPGVTKEERGQYQSDGHVEHEKLFWKSQTARLKVLQAYRFQTERLLTSPQTYNNSTSKVFRMAESFSESGEVQISLCGTPEVKRCCAMIYTRQKTEICIDSRSFRTLFRRLEHQCLSSRPLLQSELGVSALKNLNLCNIPVRGSSERMGRHLGT